MKDSSEGMHNEGCDLQDISGWGRNSKWERGGIKTFLGETSVENIRNKG